MFCGKCGKEIEENLEICPFCGCLIQENRLENKSINSYYTPIELPDVWNLREALKAFLLNRNCIDSRLSNIIIVEDEIHISNISIAYSNIEKINYKEMLPSKIFSLFSSSYTVLTIYTNKEIHTLYTAISERDTIDNIAQVLQEKIQKNKMQKDS